MRRIYWRPWVLQPIWHALLAWLFTAVLVLAGSGEGGNPAGCALAVMAISLFLASVFALVSVIVSVGTYRTAERYLRRLLLLYLALVLLFAHLYFLLNLLPTDSPFVGVHSAWHWLPDNQGRRIALPDAGLSALDCLHFSCVTITTLGYGDMHPSTWYTKLAADVEVLLGVGLIAVGLGRLLSREGRTL